MKLHYFNELIDCTKAVKSEKAAYLFDKNDNLIFEIQHIAPKDWPYIILEDGEWTDISEIPTELDKLRADVDYILMILDE